MSYGSVTLENDIRARALALADALVSTNADRYRQVREEFQAQAAAARLPPDEMTWFALERVALRAGVQAVRVVQEGTPIPAGALVLIAPQLPAPETPEDPAVRALRSAGFVVAPAEWGPVLRAARLSALSIDDAAEPLSTAAAPTAAARKPNRP